VAEFGGTAGVDVLPDALGGAGGCVWLFAVCSTGCAGDASAVVEGVVSGVAVAEAVGCDDGVPASGDAEGVVPDVDDVRASS
jgi:hypothetical protein